MMPNHVPHAHKITKTGGVIMQTGEVDFPHSSSSFQGLIMQLNRFVDRDMVMRYHWGLGVGHVYSRIDGPSQPIVAASRQLIEGHTGDHHSIQEPSGLPTSSGGSLQTTSTALENPEKELWEAQVSRKSSNSKAVPEARVQDTDQRASHTGGDPPSRKHDDVRGPELIGVECTLQQSAESQRRMAPAITTPEREDLGDRSDSDAAPMGNAYQFNMQTEDDCASIDLGDGEVGPDDELLVGELDVDFSCAGLECEDLGFLDMYGADSDEELGLTCSYD
jgi:hypothetical protein